MSRINANKLVQKADVCQAYLGLYFPKQTMIKTTFNFYTSANSSIAIVDIEKLKVVLS